MKIIAFVFKVAMLLALISWSIILFGCSSSKEANEYYESIKDSIDYNIDSMYNEYWDSTDVDTMDMGEIIKVSIKIAIEKTQGYGGVYGGEDVTIKKDWDELDRNINKMIEDIEDFGDQDNISIVDDSLELLVEDTIEITDVTVILVDEESNNDNKLFNFIIVFIIIILFIGIIYFLTFVKNK